MIKKAKKLLAKLKNNLKTDYLKFLKLPVDDRLVLVEGGQGSNINGNMFSMLKEIETNPRWSEYKTVFVVTENTADRARERMSFYGFNRVTLLVRNSKAYCKALATAKYIMTDNSFPPYFQKRNEQVFLNTWHGTPLKTLGKSDKSNLASLANIQKNYLMSDYALFPNEFTRDVFMNDYDLKYIFKNKSLIANYPRNYVFYDTSQGAQMKEKLNLAQKQVFAYMPTWRGTGRTASIESQLNDTMSILTELDKKLGENQVVLVNLHFLLASQIDCDSFKHIKAFPQEYDTYEVLNACDGLITDYSSVFFDYAVSKRKIILFAYDKEEYLSTRGVYMPFDELPFPIVENVDGVVSEMTKPVADYGEFIEKFCPNGDERTCERLFELMVTGKSDYYSLDDNKTLSKKLCLMYVGSIPANHYENIKEYIRQNPDFDYLIAYRHNFTKDNREYILSLNENISTFGTVTAFQFTAREAAEFRFGKNSLKKLTSSCLDGFFKREARRVFHSIEPARVVDFSCGNLAIAGMLSHLSGEKQFVRHGDFMCSSQKHEKTELCVKNYEKAMGFVQYDMYDIENKLYLESNIDGIANSSFRINSYMRNILPFYTQSAAGLKCVSLFSFKTPIKTRLSDTYIMVGQQKYQPKFISAGSKLSKSHFGIYSFTVRTEDLIDMPANNEVCLCYKNRFDHDVCCHAVYFAPLGRIFLGLRGPILREKTTDTVAIFRQTQRNRLNVYVRSWIKSDKAIERIKQDIACVLSRFWCSEKAKNLVILYEKNSSKYEESASVTFEKLIDLGYDNAYFIVDRDYEYIDRIPQRYLDHIIYKHTFKHYLYFFSAKTFIGTEQPVHAIDLKIFNVLALKKISSKNINYVFLQHGVMYMVSLDSESRKMFKRKRLNGKYRVVVSSQAEADHFVQLGRHYPEDLYITGLPKFDKNILKPDADKIVIMPTWRPWEINMARDDFTQTNYFKMVMRIYDNVPDELKSKVVILPHPLIVNELRKLPEEIIKSIVLDARYDDVLMQTRLLITDYSSIAYDSFYRGSRVIFYWEEKDECMAQYGPTTKLMLNEENVYGDYFYNTEGLTEAIKRNYDNPQEQKYIDRYSVLVQYHDGRNTERLIECLKNDEII